MATHHKSLTDLRRAVSGLYFHGFSTTGGPSGTYYGPRETRATLADFEHNLGSRAVHGPDPDYRAACANLATLVRRLRRRHARAHATA